MQDKEKFFDVRIYKRYIKEGHITQKDYEEYVDALTDVSEKAMPLVIDEEGETEEREE